MKTHLINMKDKNSSACGRHRHLGANRYNEIYIVTPSMFANEYKTGKYNCCANCVKEYNRIVLERKGAN